MKRRALFCLVGLPAVLSLAATMLLSSPAVADDRVDEAGARFRRGVELYAEGDLGAALVEFTRAYELSPRYRILYNLGQITYQQQDYVTTLRHFRRYLVDGGDDVPPARRREVQQEIRRLEQRIGRLNVQAAPEARIFVDGASVGVAPLGAAMEANVGRRRVSAVSPQGERWERVVDLAGGDLVTVTVGPPLRRPAALESSAAADDAPLPLASAMENQADEGQGARASSMGRRAWLAWAATAVLAAGAGAAGGLALSASHDLKDARQSYPVMADELGRLHDRTRLLSLIADGALAGTVIMAAVSTYLTLHPTPAAAERVSLRPMGVGLQAFATF